MPTEPSYLFDNPDHREPERKRREPHESLSVTIGGDWRLFRQMKKPPIAHRTVGVPNSNGAMATWCGKMAGPLGISPGIRVSACEKCFHLDGPVKIKEKK